MTSQQKQRPLDMPILVSEEEPIMEAGKQWRTQPPPEFPSF